MSSLLSFVLYINPSVSMCFETVLMWTGFRKLRVSWIGGDQFWAVAEGWERLKAVWEIQGDVKDLIFTLMWLIWFTHNPMVHDSVSCLIEGIINRADALLSYFRNANGSCRVLLDPVPTKWVAPSHDFYKFNFDVSWTKELNEVWVEVVIRDNRGKFYLMLSKFSSKASSWNKHN